MKRRFLAKMMLLLTASIFTAREGGKDAYEPPFAVLRDLEALP